MLCHQAQRRLDDFNWCYSDYCRDPELIAHLQACPACSRLVQAEEDLRREFQTVRNSEPAGELSIDMLRRKVAESSAGSLQRKSAAGVVHLFLAPGPRRRFALATAMVVLAVLALIPFNFREKVGYEIAIAGVEKDVALNYEKANSLLDALGMEKGEATNLLDSLGVSQIQFSVGECSETCRLTISDLKTERDVRLMVKAIIDLGCCQIDNIIPIFRSESTSLLGLAARKLLS